MNAADYPTLIKMAHTTKTNLCFYGLEDNFGYNLTDLSNDLDSIGLTHKCIHTNILDQYDFEISTPQGVVKTNIFDGVDVVVLNDFSKAMPIVQGIIVQWFVVNKERPTFIIFDWLNANTKITTVFTRLGFVYIDMEAN